MGAFHVLVTILLWIYAIIVAESSWKHEYHKVEVEALYLKRPTLFERWQSANKGLPLGSVEYHLGSIVGV